MKYNFNEHIGRYGTCCAKWDMAEAYFGKKDLLPMWVADTDLRCPDEVIEALKERINHPIFGYSRPDDEVYEVIIQRMKNLYNWDIKKEWILFNAGIISGCHIAVRALTNLGDQVVIQTPVYYPFKKVILANGCTALENGLVRRNNRYYMNLEQLADMFKQTTGFGGNIPRIKATILCNPHNPVGRVWTKEELLEYGDICLKNDAVIITDDIHSDLLLNGNKHVMLPSLSKELEQKSITFIAPSKTFNVAGLKASVAIIPNDQLRMQFAFIQEAGYGTPNVLGMTSLKAAYMYGDQYIKDLNAHLENNLEYFTSYINKNIPELTVIEPEGTYLVWVDMARLGMNPQELAEFMINDVKVATDFGYVFGPGGETFQRFNLGCTLDTVKECLRRLDNAVSQWRQKK